jgi:hypothetical protein
MALRRPLSVLALLALMLLPATASASTHSRHAKAGHTSAAKRAAHRRKLARLRRAKAAAARKKKPAPTTSSTPTTTAPAPAPAPVPTTSTTDSGTAATTTPTTSSAPASPAAPSPYSTTRAVGSSPLTDAQAAALVTRSSFEPRAQNAAANARVPTASELQTFHNSAPAEYNGPVTGNFTGTTSEIIQWAAWKWGVDEDVLRAQAVQESWWDQTFAGDGGVSYGLFQIKSTEAPWSAPLSHLSTAFNADYYAAQLRYCYDGHLGWLNTVERGSQYAAGDLWGCLGVWYSGRWYTPSAVSYINSVKSYLATRRWEQPGF